MLGAGDYLWRLIPGNPILLRVVETGGKRRRDLVVRCVYLGLLIFFVLISIIGGAGMGEFSRLTQTSTRIFQNLSNVQLLLVALLAPIFTAGAITQERDSQTYDILLATPLTNAQIVLGSLLSRLFFVLALLISGIPVFSITQIFGGVAIQSIVHSFLIAASTALVTGAMAMAIATFKVGTRRTIFSFYLFIVIYLVGLYLLDMHPAFQIEGYRNDPQTPAHISWFTGIHPFLALRVLFNDNSYRPPLSAEEWGWPINWYLTSPHTFYIYFMTALSVVLVLPSIALLRRLAQSTLSIKGAILQKLRFSSGDRTRKPRSVWFNPIAWREAKTKASAARASVMRYGFIAAGIAGAIVLLALHVQKQLPAEMLRPTAYDASTQTLVVIHEGRPTTYRLTPNTDLWINQMRAAPDALRGGEYKIDLKSANGNTLTMMHVSPIDRKLNAPEARSYLLGAAIVEFAVILLIVTNAAASTVTREKEDGSLDLLLTTPITSRYYIWGKLRGLVSFVLPLLAVPVVSVGLFVTYDLLRFIGGTGRDAQWTIFPESVLILPAMLVIVVAFAAILGMQMSLRCRTTVRAVMSSVGIVIGVCGALGWCGWQFMETADSEIALVFGSFSPFTVLTVMIDPYRMAGGIFSGADHFQPRLLLFVFSWVATGAYAMIVWSMYKSMVRNFDMTIRRQSR